MQHRTELRNMAAPSLQKQRFELKYIMDEAQALAIRDFVRCYLDLDPHGEGQPDLSYPVHSLYLDSPSMQLYHSTINGNKNRFKLRVRFYDENQDSPVFLEIKRRMNNIISKKRVGVKREGLFQILSGQAPHNDLVLFDASDSTDSSLRASQEDALHDFTAQVNQLQAQPVSHVAYQREAWVLPESNAVRVTLDRKVCCEADPQARMLIEMHQPTFVFGDQVILELKFTDRFPNWFRELVESYHLMQCGAAKYVDGITLMDKDAMSDMVESQMLAQQIGPRDHLKRRQAATVSSISK